MPAVTSFGIQYGNVDYAQIAAAGLDLIVTEGNGDAAPGIVNQLDPAEVAALQAQGRLVVGYVNVGVTDANRAYWQDSWTANSPYPRENDDRNAPNGTAPAWLQGEPTNPYGVYTDFLDPAWQEIVIGQVRRLVGELGYSGVYLDDVNAYYQRVAVLYPGDAIQSPEAQAMIRANADAMSAFVALIRSEMLEVNPDAVLVASTDPYFMGNTNGGASSAAAVSYRASVDIHVLDNMPNEAALQAARTALAGETWLILQSDGSMPAANGGGTMTAAQLRGYAPAWITGSADYTATPVFDHGATAGADTLTGGDGANALAGGEGNDWLDGGAGDDLLEGGNGDDTILTGKGEDVAHGGEGNDVIAGSTNTSRSARLPEGGGVRDTDGNDGNGYAVEGGDSLYGDGGDDRIHAGYATLVNGGSGIDTVDLDLRFTWVPWVAHTILYTYNELAVDLDLALATSGTLTVPVGGSYPGLDLTLTGIERFDITFGDGDDRVFGGAYDDVLNGEGHAYADGADELHGRGGNDRLDGSGGADFLYGDAGNDELRGGTRGAGFDDGYRDHFFGGEGDDLLDARTGDVLDGGAGFDTAILRFYDNAITYALDLSRMFSPSVAYALGDGGSVVGIERYSEIVLAGGNDRVSGSVQADIVDGAGGDDTLSGLGGDDDLNGVGGNDRLTGGDGADILDGGIGNDILEGGTGADRMIGWTGDDRFHVDNGGDVVMENGSGGYDTVHAVISYTLTANVERLVLAGTSALNGTGNALANALTGNANANILDGGIGADTMQGGGGDDIYVVDNAGDLVTELDGEGSDIVNAGVTFSLAGQFVEVLDLTGAAAINGTGNGLGNRIVGNAAANILYGLDGNDRLDGGAGADRMRGGLGNDVFVVDHAGDLVEENNGEGIDTVEAWIGWNLTGSYVESLRLMGSANLNGTGNGLANELIGNAGNNVLNGNGGADTMRGGAGDDRYIVDNAGDAALELNGEGYDVIEASVSFSLAGQYVEELRLAGSAAINGTGNSQANALWGNGGANLLRGEGGADTLHGGLGSDTLSGGAGQDQFWFETALGATNIDTIADFVVVDDSIHLDRTIFAGIAANGTLAAGAFRIGTAALDADDRILYDAATGNLRYDADGVGGVAAVQFAKLSAGLALTAADFIAVP